MMEIKLGLENEYAFMRYVNQRIAVGLGRLFESIEQVNVAVTLLTYILEAQQTAEFFL
jgi:hypothetical protein